MGDVARKVGSEEPRELARESAGSSPAVARPFDFADDRLTHPLKILVRFRRHGSADVGKVKVEMDHFNDILARCNSEFGDPARYIGGPELPAREEPKRRRKAA